MDVRYSERRYIMPRILISGYYGFNNAGDDTVLFGIISSLKKQDADLQLAVLSNKPKETEQLFKIPAYNRWKLIEIMRGIRHSDLLVMGGGSLLQDATSPRSVIYYLGIVKIAKWFKKPVVFFAQGVGPIRHRLSRYLIKRIVNQVDVITVRDQQSGRDLQSLGVTEAPIRVTADPALTIDPRRISMTKGQTILQTYPTDPDQPSMVISVRDWKNIQRFKKEVADVADGFIRSGWNVIFLPMHYPADIDASRDIIKQMRENGAVLLDQKYDFRHIMSIIGNVDFVLGMRLHSIILAAVMNVPFAALSYDPKIDRFVERVGMKSVGDIRQLDRSSMERAIHPIIHDLEATRKQLKLNMADMVQTAAESGRLTLDVLKRTRT